MMFFILPSDKSYVTFEALSKHDSKAAIAANAQQFPPACWSFTEVTKPSSRKSYLVGKTVTTWSL